VRLTHDQKEQIVNSVWINGTLESAINDNITMESIQTEMKKSAVFKKRVDKALKESRGMLIDEARALVRDYMRGKYDKTDRNRLTAAIALLNAYEPGFKGTTTVQGKIDHDVRVITAVPRPNYQIIEPEKKLLDNPAPKVLKSKKVIVDEQGNYIGTQTVEEAIEGEVVNGDS
jgi:hypothetical protein